MVTIEKILDIHLSPSIPHLPAKEPVLNTVSIPFKLRNEVIYSQLCVLCFWQKGWHKFGLLHSNFIKGTHGLTGFHSRGLPLLLPGMWSVIQIFFFKTPDSWTEFNQKVSHCHLILVFVSTLSEVLSVTVGTSVPGVTFKILLTSLSGYSTLAHVNN